MRAIILAILILFASPTFAQQVVPQPGEQWQIGNWCRADDAKGIAFVVNALKTNNLQAYKDAINSKDTSCVDIRLVPLPPERVVVLKGLFLIRHNATLCGRFFLAETLDRAKVKLVFWFRVPCPKVTK